MSNDYRTKDTEQYILNDAKDDTYGTLDVTPYVETTPGSVAARVSGSTRGGKTVASVEIVDASGNQITTFGAAGGATETTLGTVHGHVDSIDTKTPALGQALAAASVPVILPSATITTLTPPAAITGFATSAKQDTLLTELQAKADVTETQPVSLASVPSHAVTNAGTFATQVDGAALTALQLIDNFISGSRGLVTEDNSGSIKTAVETIDNCISGSEAQVDVVAPLPTGTNSIGSVRPDTTDLNGASYITKKYYTNAGAVTDGIVWSPAAGTRWHITDIYIQVSAAATVTLEDDKAGGDDPIWKAELAANSGWSHSFKTPWVSGEDAADLIITTTAGNVYVTVVGYEI